MNEKCLFKATLDVLPPSVNDMYIHTKWGPRPSAKMKKFKAAAKVSIAKQLDFDAEPLDPNEPHIFVVDYYLPALFNKGWPEKAKTRFKRRDVSNLIKVLEDVVAECLGIDDSCFVDERVKKHDGGKEDFVGLNVRIYRCDEPEYQ